MARHYCDPVECEPPQYWAWLGSGRAQLDLKNATQPGPCPARAPEMVEIIIAVTVVGSIIRLKKYPVSPWPAPPPQYTQWKHEKKLHMIPAI